MGHPPPYPPYSQYPQYPQYPPPPTPAATAGDRVASIIALVLTALMLAACGFMGLTMLAFLDYCPPDSCSVEGAVLSVMGAVGAAVAIGVVGLVVTVVRLSRRRTGWPFAVGTLFLCGAVLAVGLFAFSVSVGGW